MTTKEFKSKFGIDKCPIYWKDGHCYVKPELTAVTILVNKDIQPTFDKGKIKIFPYHSGTYVASQDEEMNPYGIPIEGNWTAGYSLDLHTLESTHLGVNENGRDIFDTKRPWIANELFRLKYRRDKSKIEPLGLHASEFIKSKNHDWQIDLIVPVPPSDTTRAFQPVFEIASSVSKKLGIPVDLNLVNKMKSTSEIKGISDLERRRNILKDAFDVKKGGCTGKNILIIDDLFRSGETLRAMSEVLSNKGEAENIFVITITKTRTNR